MSSLESLRELLLAEGEPLAGAMRSAPTAAPVIGPLAAAGPRAARDRATYELLLEAIYEGYLLHYDHSRLIETSDPNLPCSRAIASTRSASSASLRSATSRRWESSPR